MHFHYVSMHLHVYTQDQLLSQNLDKLKLKS